MEFSVAVAGASGYAGGELLRLLSEHPRIRIETITAHSNVGLKLSEVHPHLRSIGDMVFSETTAQTLAGHDVVFFALPHGQSGAIAAAVEGISPQTLLIDCGADHRLEDQDDWQAFYGGGFNPSWTYGVPELPIPGGKQRKRLVGTKRIAAPGCNASALSLSLAPGVKFGLIDPSDIVATLVVGPSGAGRSLKTHLLASELLGNARPYSVAGTHRHIPEVRQSVNWARQAGADSDAFDFRLALTPVLVPVARGILATISAPLTDPDIRLEDLHAAWVEEYENEEFVQVLPAGEMPQLSDVIGANTALIGVAIDRSAKRALIVTVIDNLVKGTAGAAIQSMNIALNIDESLGLTTNGVAP